MSAETEERKASAKRFNQRNSLKVKEVEKILKYEDGVITP